MSIHPHKPPSDTMYKLVTKTSDGTEYWVGPEEYYGEYTSNKITIGQNSGHYNSHHYNNSGVYINPTDFYPPPNYKQIEDMFVGLPATQENLDQIKVMKEQFDQLEKLNQQVYGLPTHVVEELQKQSQQLKKKAEKDDSGNGVPYVPFKNLPDTPFSVGHGVDYEAEYRKVKKELDELKESLRVTPETTKSPRKIQLD